MNYDDVFFQAGDVLFDRTSPSSKAFFIMEGRVELELHLGKKSMKIQMGENQFIGDAAVAVTHKSNSANLAYRGRAIALEPVHAISIPIDDIKQELENCPPLLKAWFTSFINRVLIVIKELSND